MSNTPSLPLPGDEWKLKVNAQYQEAMKLFLSLVTASLVLPIAFIRMFFEVAPGHTVAEHLGAAAYWSWFLLSVALVFGMVFYWSSAKFVKLVCGGRESRSEGFYEGWRDVSIGVALFCFASGLICFLWFVAHLSPIR